MWQAVLIQPAVPLQDHLLVYGDFGYVHALHVPQWHLAAALNSMEVQLMEAEVSSRRDAGACRMAACVLRPYSRWARTKHLDIRPSGHMCVSTQH